MLRFGRHLVVPLIAVAAACSGKSDDAPAIDDAGLVDASASEEASSPNDGASDSAAPDAGLPPIGDCPMGPSPGLPPESPRILVIAPESSATEHLIRHLRGIFAGDSAFTSPEIVSVPTTTSASLTAESLANFWYSPQGRDERLAPLAGPFDWVVMLEAERLVLHFPELHFEGVRVLACRARAAGAKPILLQPWSPSGSYTADNGEIAYRVGNGTGTPVLPAGYAWEAALRDQDGGPATPGQELPTHAAFAAAAGLYHGITGRSAEATTYQPTDIVAAERARLAAITEQAIATHATTAHYTAPFASRVQRRTTAPSPELWFMTSGTSSEAIYADRVNEILPKLAITPRGTAIGACNESKRFDEACLELAKPSFAAAKYQILFARDYGLESETIRTAGAQADLQVQIWDRHPDGLPTDGAEVLKYFEGRNTRMIELSRVFGLAWIPYHLMFAKLKLARPSVQLTSDGTHATYPVGYGLAAMSIESRTSLIVPTDGLDADTAAAVRLGDETIRQLSTLSQWGTFVPDDPAARPKIR